MRGQALRVALRRQEKGKRSSASGDVNSSSNNEFAATTTSFPLRRKGK